MKWVALPILLLLLPSALFFCCGKGKRVVAFEECLDLSALTEENSSIDVAQTEGTRATFDLRENFLRSSKTLTQQGVSNNIYTYQYAGEIPELAADIAAKIPFEGEVDYRGFAFQDRIPPLIQPLTQQELCYVFASIVASAAQIVRINGRLEEISFLQEDQTVSAFARVALDLSDLKAACGLSCLPEETRFCIWMEFIIENSDISVNYDKIKIQCETFELPEATAVFVCSVIFGKKNYKKLFGEAVRNVLINARIYG